MEGALDTNWYLDSGVPHHLTNDMNNMHVAEPFAGISKLVVGNGANLSITHLGHATLRCMIIIQKLHSHLTCTIYCWFLKLPKILLAYPS